MGERSLQADTLSLKDSKGRDSPKPPLGSHLHIGLGCRAEEVRGLTVPLRTLQDSLNTLRYVWGGTVPVPTGSGNLFEISSPVWDLNFEFEKFIQHILVL